MIQEWQHEAVFLSMDTVFAVAEQKLNMVDRKVYQRSCFNMRQVMILDWIETNPEPVELRDIVGRFGGAVDSMRVVLNRWVKRGQLQRVDMLRQGTKVPVAGFRVRQETG